MSPARLTSAYQFVCRRFKKIKTKRGGAAPPVRVNGCGQFFRSCPDFGAPAQFLSTLFRTLQQASPARLLLINSFAAALMRKKEKEKAAVQTASWRK
ncbi:MAG: hypothetical protein QM296_01650 [Bacillota bacterium]|nr:hypothetical protein [Bacillota bacterium]